MNEERIQSLIAQKEARESIYGAASPTRGRKKLLHQEARRRLLRGQAMGNRGRPALKVVQGGGE
ncbi:hypothetical protein TK90_2882 (plasmid) [Thioalkalivibrio sp. K90mix]|nr:hypothetical protein TK90_2882 [Thioalkalivibrio sp. K90mix]